MVLQLDCSSDSYFIVVVKDEGITGGAIEIDKVELKIF